jgi:hypothetical protein
MQIQRVEPDLIPPAEAPDRSDRVVPDRRPRKQRGDRQHHEKPEGREPRDEPPPRATTYTPRGHVDPPDPGGHALDRQA